MMKATPPSPLIVTKHEFLLEILIVPLDPPAQLGGIYQGTAADVRGQRGQKVFRRLGFVRGPFDQAPFLGSGRGAVIIAMRGPDTHGGEARGEPGVAPFAPGDPPPGCFGKVQRQLLGRDRLMLDVTTDRGRPTTTPAPFLRCERFHAARPHAPRGLNAHGIGQPAFRDSAANVRVAPTTPFGPARLRTHLAPMYRQNAL